MTPRPHPLDSLERLDPLDLLMEDVLHDLANPLEPAAFAATILNDAPKRSLTMTSVSPATNLLRFHTLDRSAGRSLSPQSIGIAILFNVAALLLLTLQLQRAGILTLHPVQELSISLPPKRQPAAPKALKMIGGGGGQPGVAPVTQGNPPKSAAEQLNPPRVPPLAEPRIRIEPTIDVQADLHMAKVDVPSFGLPHAPLVGSSLGNGSGAGLGSGNGSGVGPGSGGNVGGGIKRIGGGVSAPIVLFAPEPQFSEEARKARVSGNVLVYLQVDTNGRPTRVRVLRGIGMGLDQKALEAVRQYKFKPAMENGHPVPVEMNIEVNFNIF